MKVRYVVLLMLVSLSIITYLDRISIGVAGSAIQKDLGISDQAWGWVLGAFLLSYGIFEIPSGAWGDRFGQRKVLTRIVLWWSVFTALTPLARNFYLLVATRFMFGAGEAGAYPNASGCIGRWFPLAERARAQGMVWGASRLGGALTPLLVIPLIKGLGWQACFWLFGGLGLVWAAVWYVWFRDDPAEHAAVTEAELLELGYTSAAVSPVVVATATPVHARAYSASSPNPCESPVFYADVEATRTALTPPVAHSAHSGVPWGLLFASPQLWLIIAMYFFYVFGFIFFMFWLPKFLTTPAPKGRGMSQEHMAIVVALMFTSGAIGNVIGGWASDWLSKRFGLSIGRKLIGVTCLALSGLILFAIAFTPDQTSVSALVIMCFGIADGMLPCSWAICLDVGKQYSGAVSGAMNTAGQAAGFICTVLLGSLVTWFGNYDSPLMFLAPSLLISAVLFALIDPTRPLVPERLELAGAE